MCQFTVIESFKISDHLFEFNRSGGANRLGLVIVKLKTGIPIIRLFMDNHAYKIVDDTLQCGTIDTANCTEATDKMPWPNPDHFIDLKDNTIIGIGDIRDGERYVFSFDLTKCPLQLGYLTIDGPLLFTLPCTNSQAGACMPTESTYNPNPCFSSTKIP